MIIGDISYKEYRKKNDIHGSILYPAVMVAPIQKRILEKLIMSTEVRNIFDPFHGSGTALYEAMEICEDITLLGCDINPLANLITKVKLQGVSENIESDIKKLKSTIESNTVYEIHRFKNIEKWFRLDIIESLSRIRSAIMTIEDKQNRLYFWYMLCDIIRRYSNTRSATYKLHIKEKESIYKIQNKVIDEYIYSIQINFHKFKKRSKNFELYKCNILDKIKELEDDSIDISITSPPYGENATTVTYGQFSILSLYWIDSKDLELEGWELNNFSIIDTNSLGGRSKHIALGDFEYGLIKHYVDSICDSKKVKVIRFFNDYFEFIRGLIKITSKYIVMTLGNRTVDGVNIDLTSITQKMLEHNGFKENQFIERKIPSKRIPEKTSKVNNKPVNSMNYEYIIIYQKIKEK